MRKSKGQRLFSYNILKEEYTDRKKKISQIANDFGCSSDTVHRWLIRNNIPIRKGRGRQNEDVDISSILEILRGELLGDGGLGRTRRNACFRYQTKHREYLEYLISLLDNILKFSKIHRSENRYKNYKTLSITYQASSMRYPSLTKLYKQWYSNGKKVIPKNLKLTPTICRHWYIGDGYLYPRAGITLCTESFSKEDLENIILPQLSLFNAYLIHVNFGFGYRVYIRKKYVRNFLDYIGSCPIKCYKYKWRHQIGC